MVVVGDSSGDWEKTELIMRVGVNVGVTGSSPLLLLLLLSSPGDKGVDVGADVGLGVRVDVDEGVGIGVDISVCSTPSITHVPLLSRTGSILPPPGSYNSTVLRFKLHVPGSIALNVTVVHRECIPG